jgi:hypothetical protein
MHYEEDLSFRACALASVTKNANELLIQSVASTYAAYCTVVAPVQSTDNKSHYSSSLFSSFSLSSSLSNQPFTAMSSEIMQTDPKKSFGIIHDKAYHCFSGSISSAQYPASCY